MSKGEDKNLQNVVSESSVKEKSQTKTAKPLEELLGGVVKANEALSLGLSNLATLSEIAGGRISVAPLFNKPFLEGAIGFRRSGGSLGLTVACGTAQAQTIPLGKYVALVEKMYDPDRPSIVLQKPSDPDNKQSGRGMILSRIVPGSSAIVIGLGYSGRIVEKLEDYVTADVYYLSRSVLAAFYIAAKMQLSTEDTLNELITAFEGWYKFGIPLDHCNPYELGGAMVKDSSVQGKTLV